MLTYFLKVNEIAESLAGIQTRRGIIYMQSFSYRDGFFCIFAHQNSGL